MKRPAQALLQLLLLAVTGVSAALPGGGSAFAAEPPVLTDAPEMAVAVRKGLNEVIALMDAQKLDDAVAAMARMRAMPLQAPLTDYEKLVMLQTSGALYTLQQKHREAAADYEAILQLATLSDADRLASTKLAGQLYLQVGDWNKGLEHLLALNELQAGGDMETLFRIAFSYSQIGQVTAAIPYMEQALAVGGAQVGESYYMNMAVLYMQAADHANAIATYEQLLTSVPQTAQRELVSANLAALYLKVGDNAKARAMLETLISDFPDSTQLATYQQSLTALYGARP